MGIWDELLALLEEQHEIEQALPYLEDRLDVDYSPQTIRAVVLSGERHTVDYYIESERLHQITTKLIPRTKARIAWQMQDHRTGAERTWDEALSTSDPASAFTRLTRNASYAERDFQTYVMKYAHTQGWYVWDERPAWEAGYPDIALQRRKETLLAELKTNAGGLAAHQVELIERLRDEGIEVHVWRPIDAPSIIARLAVPAPNTSASESAGRI